MVRTIRVYSKGVTPDLEPNSAGARRKFPKIERNQPCPCGSAIKYKKCCKDIFKLSETIRNKQESK